MNNDSFNFEDSFLTIFDEDSGCDEPFLGFTTEMRSNSDIARSMRPATEKPRKMGKPRSTETETGPTIVARNPQSTTTSTSQARVPKSSMTQKPQDIRKSSKGHRRTTEVEKRSRVLDRESAQRGLGLPRNGYGTRGFNQLS